MNQIRIPFVPADKARRVRGLLRQVAAVVLCLVFVLALFPVHASAASTSSAGDVGMEVSFKLANYVPGDKAVPEDTLQYEITWQATKSVKNVAVNATLSKGETAISASNGAGQSADGKTYMWELGDLEADATGTMTYSTKVNSDVQIGDIIKDNVSVISYDDEETQIPNYLTLISEIQITQAPQKEAVRQTKGILWRPGDQLTYTITGWNYSDTDNTVTIIDPLDPGVSYVASDPKGTYDSKTHTVTWIINDVAPGKEVSVTCFVSVNSYASKKGIITNKAAVQVGSFKPKDTNPVPDEVDDGTPVKSVVEPADGGPVKVGDTVVFEIRGYVAGYTVTTITDKLDEGLEYVGDDAGGNYDSATRTVTWTIPESPLGTPYVIHLTTKVLLKAEQQEEVVNQARAEFDNTVKWTNEVVVPVEPRTPEKKLVGIQPGDGSPLVAGDTINYEIKWYNTTDKPATITVKDSLPAGVSIVRSDHEYTIADDTVVWKIENVEPESTGIIKFTVRLDVTPTTDIRNQAQVQINNEPEENTNEVVIPVKYGGFLVTKLVEGDSDRYFNFVVKLDQKINGRYGDLYFLKGIATFRLKKGGSVTASYLPAGTNYTITEVKADGYTTSITPGSIDGNIYTGTIKYGYERIDFTNTFHTGDLNISKAVTGEGGDTTKAFLFNIEFSDRTLNGTYDGVVIKNGVGSFTLKHNETKTLTGLPAGVEYVIRESGEANYTTKANGVVGSVATGEIVESKSTEVKFENAYSKDEENPWEPTVKTGDLAVKKTVTGGVPSANEGKKFTFTVKLDDETIDGTYGGMAFTKGEATVSVGDGETVTATGLPVNTRYTVTEESVPGYLTTVNDVETSTAEGRILDGETVTEAFVNKTYGGLKLTKTVDGLEKDENQEFHFTVKLSDNSIQGMYGSMVFVNGVASVTLKHGQSATAENLPVGISYTVTEAETNKDGFKTVAPGNTGTIQLGETAVASFTNSRVAEKKVTNVEPGVSVQPGAVLEYTIDWYNREGAVADITITDTLDENVTFVEAVDGEYNSETHTVTWNLPDREIGASGSVTLKVRVNSAAAVAGETVNQATVTVNGFEVETNPVEVPVEPTPTIVPKVPDEPDEPDEPDTPEEQKPEKTEVKPGAGVAVLPGTEIEYEITWKNNSKETADIVITDVLDAGVSYGSATVDGAYDPDTRTVTWTIPAQAAGASGSVSLTVTVNEDAVETVKNQASVQVGNEAAVQTNVVENPVQQTGGLSLTKQVTGENGDMDRVWHFVVTLDDAGINGTYGEMEFVGGVASVALKHGETKTADGLPAGVGYAVEETEANQDLYSTSSENAAGTIAAGETVIVQFINQKQDQPIADIPEEDIPEADDTYILVRKVVTGSLGEKDKDFHFTVKLSDTGINGKYGEMEFVDGAAEFTLRSGEYKWGVGLPTGVTYTVSEAEADADGYVTISSGTTRELVGTGIYEVRFQNHKGDWRPEDDEPWEDLPIPEIPRTYLDQPDEPETDTPDADVPVTEDKTPKTGDVGTWEIWLVMAAGALLAAGITLSWKQKSEE